MDYKDQCWREVAVFLVLISSFGSCCYGYQFVVGGAQGWISNPSENYNHWAERNRFQISDSLLFKYNSRWDSVLVVNRADYNNCDAANPIHSLDDGNSIFQFNLSDHFWFITGNQTHCLAGQKLIVAVLAVRYNPNPPHAQPSPASPPAGGPLVPGVSPTSPPATGSPTPADAAPSPNGSQGSPTSSTPGSGTPADANSPSGAQPRSYAAPRCKASILFISLVSSLSLRGFVVSI